MSHISRRTLATEGLSLIDVVVAMGFLALVISTALGVMVTSMELDAVNSETARATAAAQDILERLEATTFNQTFSLYNAATPGGTFEVPGLNAADGELAAVGEVSFPTDPNLPLVLREDLVIPELGLPMDLNGDGLIDSADHSGDYAVLPVSIRINWRGAAGNRVVQLHALLKR